MIKKTAVLSLSITLIITGAVAFHKLSFWEESIRIFQYTNADQRNDGRGERGRGGFERGRDRDRDEKFSERTEARESNRRLRESNNRDRINQQNLGDDRERTGRARSEAGDRNRDRQGRGGGSRGNKIRLRSVLRFLAVFASLTVITIYFDIAQNKIWKRKPKNPEYQ